MASVFANTVAQKDLIPHQWLQDKSLRKPQAFVIFCLPDQDSGGFWGHVINSSEFHILSPKLPSRLVRKTLPVADPPLSASVK